MNDLKQKILAFYESNKGLSLALIGIVTIIVIAKTVLKPVRRRRRRINIKAPVSVRSRVRSTRKTNNSVRGKKPWQVKGSPDAKRRMAELRKLKGK